MIVYHGSTIEVPKPDVLHAYRNLDFGAGFYTTTVPTQAERWAKRKADITNSINAFVSEYIFDADLNNYRVLDFGDNLSTWIDFVCECRDGGEEYKNYDIIMGKVANDKVFRVVDLYKSGIWDKTRAIEEIRAYDNYDQIAFVSQAAIDASLVFSRAYSVPNIAIGD